MRSCRRTRRDPTVTDHQRARQSRRSGNRTLRVVVIGAFLFVLAAAAFFAVQSLNTDHPITDLILTAVFGFFTLALGWIIVGAWHTRR